MIIDHDHFIWAGRIALDSLQKQLIVAKLIMNSDDDAQHDVMLA
jgi:hypothetical protein